MATIHRPILQLRGSQIGQAAAVLTRAFHDDPIMEYVFPNESTRAKLASWLHEGTLNYGLLYGEICVTPNVSGVAIWLVPGSTTMTFIKALRAGMLATPFKLGLRAFWRLWKFNKLKKRLEDQSLTGKHWILMALAVEPSEQGRGIASALLAPGLARADADGLPCYLETTNEANLPFYEKYGFEVSAHAHMAGGGPGIWGMVRQPGVYGGSHP
jgi:GNAT superfamily N-acetyltransferase